MNDIIIYKEDSEGITNKVSSYIGRSGIWALFGEKGELFECLNVGKCADVGREILYDIGCMHHLTLQEDGDKDYINQFAEFCGFKYKKGQTREYLYPYIWNLHYDAIMFVYVYNESDLRKEKEFAWLTHAKFWRNGGAFKAPGDNVYERSKSVVLGTKNITVHNFDDLVRVLK